MIPDAFIGHQSAQRLRFKVSDRRGDKTYFASVKEQLTKEKTISSVQVNPLTGSVLVLAPSLDPKIVSNVGVEQGLFRLVTGPQPAVPMAQRMLMPLDTVNKGIDRLTRGDTDLAGIIFVLLLGFGVYEIARGRFRPPPWYTAFWYAFGVFTKSMVDHSKK